MDERRFDWSGRLILGLVIIALGVVLLLDRFGLADAGRILRWWPLLLVATGVSHLLGAGAPRRPVLGTVFTAIGLLLLADHLDWFDFEVWDLWPLALIALGGSMLVRHLRGPGATPGSLDSGEWIRSWAFWSGVERKANSDRFRGGELTAIMGGIEVDLRPARPEGGRCVLDVFVWWGGVEIRVPEGWKVTNEATVVMGAIEDGTRPAPDGVHTLVLRGMVVMGGVEVKH
uniref:LiaF transmembrane domain-containing protein n=1 Tax=Eiseniibacteriota bacterium TaxID=2212470 RepID=A0A832I615_UNCEI